MRNYSEKRDKLQTKLVTLQLTMKYNKINNDHLLHRIDHNETDIHAQSEINEKTEISLQYTIHNTTLKFKRSLHETLKVANKNVYE